jgi:heptosyltransferase-2
MSIKKIILATLLVKPLLKKAIFSLLIFGLKILPENRKSKGHSLTDVKKVVVINAVNLGDVLITFGWMNELRQLYPNARLDFLIREPYRSLFDDQQNIDEVIPIDISSVKKTISVIQLMRKTKYDLAILAWPASRNVVFGLLSGAKIKIGYCYAYSDKTFYLNSHTVTGIGLNDKRRISWHPNEKFDFLPGKAIEFIGGISNGFSKRLPGISSTKDYIVFHFFSRMQNRSLSKNNAEKLIREIAKRSNRSIKVIGWDTSDKILMKQIADEWPFVEFIHGKNLMDDVEIIRNARMIVCIDSGIMHLGEAFNIPIIAIFGPTKPEISLTRETVFSSIANLSCTAFEQKICGNIRCPLDTHCLDTIEIDRIVNEVEGILKH